MLCNVGAYKNGVEKREVGSRGLSGAAARTGDLKEKEKYNVKRRVS